MDWFKTWFNTPYYHLLYKDRDFQEAEQFLSLLMKDLKLPKDAKIIDLACGKGRHSIFLNQLGYGVLGLDLSEESILHNLQFENERLHFRIHDMRNEIEGEKVEAVLNLFTSFGYFENAQDDQKVFSAASNILEKDGIFVLDFMNPKWVKNHMKKEMTISKGGIDFQITKKIENYFIIKDIKFQDKGEDFHFYEKVKLHDLATILTFGEEVGLQSVKVFGDYLLNAFDEDVSPRCIVILKKI